MADPGYQTRPLDQYQEEFRALARNLFSLVEDRLPSGKVERFPGSYSVFFKRSKETAAKIIIYQQGIGKPIGNWSPSNEGVFVLLRVGRAATEQMRSGGEFPNFESFSSRINWNVTIGIAPKHGERFHFFLVTAEDSLETIAMSIVAFSEI